MCVGSPPPAEEATAADPEAMKAPDGGTVDDVQGVPAVPDPEVAPPSVEEPPQAEEVNTTTEAPAEEATATEPTVVPVYVSDPGEAPPYPPIAPSRM